MDRMDRAAGTVVFSALFNESDAFLATYVLNFLSNTGDGAFLVINLPSGRKVSCPEADGSERVLVFSGEVQRRKFGHTLLVGHLESFEHAIQALGGFDFFCPLASNSLFARPFNLQAALEKLKVKPKTTSNDLDNLLEVWWWVKVKRNPRFIAFLKSVWGLTHVSQNQIEGLFASRNDWAVLHERLPQILELGGTIEPEMEFPMEEILPATLIKQFGSGHFAFICHIFWTRSYQGKVVLADILDMPQLFPDEICILKWFERNPHDVATAAVSTDWIRNLLGQVSEDLTSEPPATRFAHRMILEQVTRVLAEREGFGPVTAGWWTEATEPARRRMALTRTVTMQRGTIPLPFEQDAGREPELLYVYAEDTQDAVRLDLEITEADSTTIVLSTSLPDEAGDADAAEPTLEGYLYLRSMAPPGNRVFRLRCVSATSNIRDQIARKVVIRHGQDYLYVSPCHVAAGEVTDFYYRQDPVAGGDALWFGIPFFNRSAATLTLDVI